MPTSFQNMATLTYTGGTVNSNIVTGELREVLTAAKTAAAAAQRAIYRIEECRSDFGSAL